MAKSKKLKSPQQLAIQDIRATESAPAKATLKKLYHFPEPDKDANPDKAYETEHFYLPSLTKLKDRDLLVELKYWARRVEQAGYIFEPSKPLSIFIDEARSLLRKMDLGRHPDRISQAYRNTVVNSCVCLRWLVVPRNNWRGPAVRPYDGGLRGPKVVRMYRSDSDWRLVQMLASLVASCEVAPHELAFVARSWKAAWDKGPDFRLSPNERKWAETLHSSFLDRDPGLFFSQGKMFQEMTGFLRRVPLWEKNPTQIRLPDFGSALPCPTEEVIWSPTPSCDGQLDLFSVSELGDAVSGGFQYRLFNVPREEVPWDGMATQVEIRF